MSFGIGGDGFPVIRIVLETDAVVVAVIGKFRGAAFCIVGEVALVAFRVGDRQKLVLVGKVLVFVCGGVAGRVGDGFQVVVTVIGVTD